MNAFDDWFIASKTSGFWTAFTPTELGHRFSTHDKGEQVKIMEMRGNIFQRINKDEKWFEIYAWYELWSITIVERK